MTLKERLDQGEYKVDTKMVADAILRNPLWILLFGDDQNRSPNSGPATS